MIVVLKFYILLLDNVQLLQFSDLQFREWESSVREIRCSRFGAIVWSAPGSVGAFRRGADWSHSVFGATPFDARLIRELSLQVSTIRIGYKSKATAVIG